MKAQVKATTLDELRAFYGTEADILEEEDTYSLYLLGGRLVLSISRLGVPLAADGSVVDLREGFTMPAVTDLLQFNADACCSNVLFVRDLRIIDAGYPRCHATVCNPEEADNILYVSHYIVSDKLDATDIWPANGSVWRLAISLALPDLKSIDRRFYEIFPLNLPNVQNNNGSNQPDVARQALIQTANQYLAFEAPEKQHHTKVNACTALQGVILR